MAKLIIRLEGEERSVELMAEVTSIGRSTDCVVPIQHRSLSRRHCEVHRVGGGYAVRDSGSLNGTAVNGKKIAGDHPLMPGDRIDVGMAQVFFERLPEKPPAPVNMPEESIGVPMVETGSALPAYMAWSQRGAGGTAGKLVIGVVSAGILLLGFAGIRYLMQPDGPPPDRDNLLHNPSFESIAAEGLPSGWSIPFVQSRVTVERREAKHGHRILVVEKARVPEEFILACASENPVETRPGEAFSLSGWIRTSRLKGVAVIRGVFRSATGIPISQIYTQAVPDATAPWKQVAVEFVTPRAAKTLTVECVVAGPEGVVQFDGLRLVRRTDATPADRGRDCEFKNYVAKIWPEGTFHVSYKLKDGQRESQSVKWILANTRLVLRTPHGTTDQAFSAGAPETPPLTRDATTGAVAVRSRILHPGTLQWLDVRQSLEEIDGELQVVYQIHGEGFRAEDELGIELAGPLDPAAVARVMTEQGEKPADFAQLSAPVAKRFIWHDNEAAYSLRYPFPLSISGGRRSNALLLSQYAGVGRGRTDPGDAAQPGVTAGIGFGLAVTLQRELSDLDKALDQGRESERLGRYSEALDVYRRVSDSAKEKNPALSAEAEKCIQVLEARVKIDLAELRKAIVAVKILAGDPAAVEAAGRTVDTLAKRYKDSPWGTDIEKGRADLEQIVAAAGDPDRDPVAPIYRLAEFHANRGDKALSQVLIASIIKYGRDSAWVEKAKELQGKLDAPAPAPAPAPVPAPDKDGAKDGTKEGPKNAGKDGTKDDAPDTAPPAGTGTK